MAARARSICSMASGESCWAPTDAPLTASVIRPTQMRKKRRTRCEPPFRGILTYMRIGLLSVTLLFACVSAGAQTLKQIAAFDLPGPGGKRFDYLTIDYE